MRLTWNDRLTIEKMLKQGTRVPDIARKIGVHQATIYREIKRGAVEILDTHLKKHIVYAPEMAEEYINQGKKNREQPLKIGHDHALAKWLVHMIGDEGYSPSAACALLGKTPETTFSCTLCRQTVYKYIDNGYLWPLTNKALRYKGKRKRQYNKVKKAARASRGDSIERRPEHINTRQEPGHWEMDCVEGKKGTKRTLLVMTERVTRMEMAFPMLDHTAASVVDVLDRIEHKLGVNRFRQVFLSITVDNGHEFMDLKGMERSITDGRPRTHMYYCHPMCPGERGSNEKQNQLIRWFFPKGTDFTHISKRRLREAIMWINSYPRKILHWSSSLDMFTTFMSACGAEKNLKFLA